MQKTTVVSLTALLLVVGCARFSTTQTDLRYEDGKPATAITTKATAYTFFSSRSDLANWKATQSEGTQGAEVGNLSQQGGTNTAATVSALAELLRAIRTP